LAALSDERYVRHFEAENYEYLAVTRLANWQNRKAVAISEEARLSFERAWGVSPEDQRVIEKSFKVEFPRTWQGVEVCQFSGREPLLSCLDPQLSVSLS